MSFADLTHPDDLDADVDALRELADGKRQRYVTEKRYLRADGTMIWISLTVSPVRDEERGTLYSSPRRRTSRSGSGPRRSSPTKPCTTL